MSARSLPAPASSHLNRPEQTQKRPGNPGRFALKLKQRAIQQPLRASPASASAAAAPAAAFCFALGGSSFPLQLLGTTQRLGLGSGLHRSNALSLASSLLVAVDSCLASG